MVATNGDGMEAVGYCGRVAIEVSGVSKSSRYGAKRRGGLLVGDSVGLVRRSSGRPIEYLFHLIYF